MLIFSVKVILANDANLVKWFIKQHSSFQIIRKTVPRGVLTCPANTAHSAMMTRILKTAEPTIVPTPTSPFVMKTPVNNKNVVKTTKCKSLLQKLHIQK